MICSTFKGVLPSELYERYNDENGMNLMELDLIVAGELSDRIKEQHEESNAKRAVAKRDQRRAERMSKEDLGNALNDFIGGGNG